MSASNYDDARQILTEIGNIKGGVGEIKGKLDGFLATQARHEELIKSLSARVSSLERTEARLYGVAGLVSILISILVPFAVRLIFGG